MKKKKHTPKVLTPMSAVVAGIALAAAGAHAQSTPVFNYDFPASWGGTGSTITDQSSANNNGVSDGTISLSAAIPPDATGGQSLVTSSGGVLTSGKSSLNNDAIQNAGGFTYSAEFLWNGTDSTSFGHTQKLIDYAGTESLQLVTTAGSASLQMTFAEGSTSAETTVLSTTILPNTWYNVLMTFDTDGNNVLDNGTLAGTATMTVNGGTPISADAVKGSYGDSLNRQIGVGQLGANFGYLVGFKGDIYNPSVSLGVGVAAVPEPSTLAMGVMGGLSTLGMWKARRRKN